MRRRNVLGCLAALLISQSVRCGELSLPPAGSRLVGSAQVITVPTIIPCRLKRLPRSTGRG